MTKDDQVTYGAWHFAIPEPFIGSIQFSAEARAKNMDKAPLEKSLILQEVLNVLNTLAST